MPSALGQVPLFAGFSRNELDELASFVRPRHYPKGSIIFHQGDPGTILYLIEMGEVKLTVTADSGKKVTLALLGPGAFFGELSLLDGGPRSANAVARVDCHLGVLDREHLLRFLAEHPPATTSLLSVVTRRLRRTTDQVQDAFFLDIPARLAKVLLQFTETRSQSPDGLLNAPKLTQEELAELVGGTRESINKCLGIYARQGFVRCHRGMVTVLKPEELRKYIF
jgi:CRP/FNR family transcriptional regulator, cyclic AMP receptor protein